MTYSVNNKNLLHNVAMTGGGFNQKAIELKMYVTVTAPKASFRIVPTDWSVSFIESISTDSVLLPQSRNAYCVRV